MNRELKEAIRRLSGVNDDPVTLILCTVDSVDADAYTCDCTPVSSNSDTIIAAVSLTINSCDGCLFIPVVGSNVIVGYSARGIAYVAMFSEIESIQFMDGSYQGLVRVKELTEKLNNIENLVNDLISKFNTHTHTGVQTGAGTSGTTGTPENNTLNTTQQSEIENTKITHGK